MPRRPLSNHNEFVAFMHRLADATAVETLSERAEDSLIDNKAGHGGYDPVTDADRAAERAARALIERHYPDHAIQGEEYGDTPAHGRYTWSIDPIDGTRSFICGLPTWTTLIALLEHGTPVLGLIDAPRLRERYVGTENEAWISTDDQKRRLATSSCAALVDARLATTDPFLFAGEDAESFARVLRAAPVARYGQDGYAYARLAAGSIDLVIEAELKPHDYNALIPVIRGAGGVIGNWRGEDDFRDGKVLAAATPALFDAAVALLSSR